MRHTCDECGGTMKPTKAKKDDYWFAKEKDQPAVGDTVYRCINPRCVEYGTLVREATTK